MSVCRHLNVGQTESRLILRLDKQCSDNIEDSYVCLGVRKKNWAERSLRNQSFFRPTYIIAFSTIDDESYAISTGPKMVLELLLPTHAQSDSSFAEKTTPPR